MAIRYEPMAPATGNKKVETTAPAALPYDAKIKKVVAPKIEREVASATARVVNYQPSGLSRADLGALLHEAVKASGSQASFAKACGVSEGYLSSIMNSERKIGPKVLRHLGVIAEVVVVYKLKGKP